MYETFIDLDELIVRCKDKQARKFIQEAVACYRAGAYRSCIVSTWNAVVFDFLHKLRELELLGDKEASKLLQEFEDLRTSQNKYKELWKFEENIAIKAMTPFELISEVEKIDIERLFKDRSRCAHPSMTSLEEPFEATAELARYHLRSAVMHLLEREPVQGRAAKERIFQAIQSDYFPIDREGAITYLRKSPLSRARFNLIKDVIIGLTVSLLVENRPEDEIKRQFSAIQAILYMYPRESREILNDNLSNIILNKVNDENWYKVIIYLEEVTVWDSITEPCQLKAIAFIQKLNIYETSKSYKCLSKQNIGILLKSYQINFLKIAVRNKLQISLKELLTVKSFCINELKNNLIDEIIRPMLENTISEASFEELISMTTENDCSLNKKIKPYLLNKLKDTTIGEIIQMLLHAKEEKLKILPNKAIEQHFLILVNEAPLETLLRLRKFYKDYIFAFYIDAETLESVITILNNKVLEKTKKLSLEEILIIKNQYSDELFNDASKIVLRQNIQKILNNFKLSYSYENAQFNASIFFDIADDLESQDWQFILKAFCENDQIFDSNGCPGIFCSLLNKSLEIYGSIQPYWLSFREELNNFSTNRHINKLKQLIDSHSPLE